MKTDSYRIHYSLLCVIVFCLTTLASFAQYADSVKLKTIVIDPGHGGYQPGAISAHVHEKEVTLAVALKFGALIEAHCPDVNVLYTRTTDVAVSLDKRSAFANSNSADLFVSIHANSTEPEHRYELRGSETYILGLHRTEDNLRQAMIENSVIESEDGYEENYEGFDPASPESYIMFNLMQNIYMEQSLHFAELVQEEFRRGPIKKDCGVKQAGFIVLWQTAAPSVLIELGYLSHPEEELILISPDKQQELAECIFRAFLRYKAYIDSEENEIAGSGNRANDTLYDDIEDDSSFYDR